MSTSTSTPTDLNVFINKFDWKTIIIIVLAILLILFLIGVFACPKKAIVVSPFTQAEEQPQYQY
jgi:hypothetical protein